MIFKQLILLNENEVLNVKGRILNKYMGNKVLVCLTLENQLIDVREFDHPCLTRRNLFYLMSAIYNNDLYEKYEILEINHETFDSLMPAVMHQLITDDKFCNMLLLNTETGQEFTISNSGCIMSSEAIDDLELDALIDMILESEECTGD